MWLSVCEIVFVLKEAMSAYKRIVYCMGVEVWGGCAVGVNDR